MPGAKKREDKVASSMLLELGRYSTPNISDACTRHRIAATCEGIISLVQGAKMVGPAVTARYRPTSPLKEGTTSDVGQYISEIAKPGDVIVIDNGGATNYTCWGGILTLVAKELQLAGAVIDGAVRDYDVILKAKYPIFSRGKTPTSGKDKFQLESINEPVSVGGTPVNPGDIMIGDDTGVVRIPKEHTQEVLADVKEIALAEQLIIELVRSGATLREARERCNYFGLQRPRNKRVR